MGQGWDRGWGKGGIGGGQGRDRGEGTVMVFGRLKRVMRDAMGTGNLSGYSRGAP